LANSILFLLYLSFIQCFYIVSNREQKRNIKLLTSKESQYFLPQCCLLPILNSVNIPTGHRNRRGELIQIEVGWCFLMKNRKIVKQNPKAPGRFF
jgi:hypothetical protein